MTATGPSDPWDDYADGWDDDPAARAYAAGAYESLVDAAAAHGLSLVGARVCDFGCGTGLLTERLADTARAIDAVDTSPAMRGRLAAKAEQRRWTHVTVSAEPPSTVGSHDLVVCSSVLGFVDDHPTTVQHLTRLLRPGGLFLHWDWERDDATDDSHGLTREESRAALVAAELTDVEVDVGFEVTIDGQTMRPLMGVGRR